MVNQIIAKIQRVLAGRRDFNGVVNGTTTIRWPGKIGSSFVLDATKDTIKNITLREGEMAIKIIEAMKKIKALQVKAEDLRKKVATYCADQSHETAVYGDRQREQGG